MWTRGRKGGGGPLEHGGGGAGVFLEINIFVGKMGIVEINILST